MENSRSGFGIDRRRLALGPELPDFGAWTDLARGLANDYSVGANSKSLFRQRRLSSLSSSCRQIVRLPFRCSSQLGLRLCPRESSASYCQGIISLYIEWHLPTIVANLIRSSVTSTEASKSGLGCVGLVAV